jgi:hypothetical protein
MLLFIVVLLQNGGNHVHDQLHVQIKEIDTKQ